MKKYTLYFVCLLMMLMTVSCKKENGDKYILNARMSNFQTSKAYIDNDRYSCFRSGESIRVNDQTCTVAPNSLDGNRTCGIANVTESQNGYYAFYPAGLLSGTPDISSSSKLANATVSLPSVQNYVYENGHQVINNPMAGHLSTSSGTIPLHNLCALLKITVKATNTTRIDNIDVTLKGTTIWGTGTVDDSQWELVMDGTQQDPGDHSTVRLDFGQNGRQGNPSGETYYIVVPKTTVLADASNSIQVKINGQYVDGTDLSKNYKTFNIALANNDNVLKNTIRLLPEVSIGYQMPYNQNCVFTVNAQNKKVTFSQRQLINVSNSGTYTVDGYSYNGISPNDRHFFTTTNFANYQINSYPLGTWRIPTQAELDYILNTRSTTSGKRFIIAYVDNHRGIIIFPDNWVYRSGSSPHNKLNVNDFNKLTILYSNVSSLSSTDWKNTFELEGCVFIRGFGNSTSSKTSNGNTTSGDPGGQGNDNNGFYAASTSNIIFVFDGGNTLFVDRNNSGGYNISSTTGVNVRFVHDLN